MHVGGGKNIKKRRWDIYIITWEIDPDGRQPYIPYEPEETNCDCIHGRDCAHTYRLYVADKTYTYDDTGKLLFAAETEEGCCTTSWRYGYDLMGNRIREEKKDPGGNVVEGSRYVYNESNQLTEALLCDGRKTTRVCYTYDEDGNLTGEYSNTDDLPVHGGEPSACRI